MGTIKDFKYKLIKNFLTKEEIKLLTDYCRMKHRINCESFDFEQNDNGDTYFYADPLMESLMINKLDIMQKETGLELLCTYAFWRMYTVNADLKKHTDRNSCEISITLNLGGEQWPIYLKHNNEEIEIKLNPSDILIYKGCEVEHWRNKFEGSICAQVFLHYNDINGPFKLNNKY